jgi:hypothetical protein
MELYSFTTYFSVFAAAKWCFVRSHCPQSSGALFPY